MESWLKPMLCTPVDVVPTGDEWVLEGKLDGWRGVAHVTHARTDLYGGRNGSSYTGKLPYVEELLTAALPLDSAVDGELLGGSWGDVQGIMTRGTGGHVPSKAIPALSYVVFDILRHDGDDLRAQPWSARREILESIPFADYGEHVQITPYGPASDELHEKMLALGLEGSVCKRIDSAYYSGRRSPLWAKIKPQATADAKVIGFKPGTKGSLFDGMVGAIEFELPNGMKSRCSGFNMQLRRALTDNPDAFIGRTIEVKHHGETVEGKLRHPQFLRFRDDRDDLTPRERQMQNALIEEAEPTPANKRARQVRKAAAPATRRMRNYGAMGDEKLMRVIRELESQGEAFQRATESGSGNPDADLAVAKGLAQERGLL